MDCKQLKQFQCLSILYATGWRNQDFHMPMAYYWQNSLKMVYTSSSKDQEGKKAVEQLTDCLQTAPSGKHNCDFSKQINPKEREKKNQNQKGSSNHCFTVKIIQGNLTTTYVRIKPRFIFFIISKAGRREISSFSVFLFLR